jgi:hypothetical protein
MSELSCCCVLEAGAATCELPGIVRPALPTGTCLSCGQKGKAVDGQTIKALLSISLAHVTHEPYLFCRTPDCPVVYFSADGQQSFTTEQVRERVYQKEPGASDVFVCYCFRHTPGSIEVEIEATGQSTAVDAINAGIRAGQCACDIRNPQGSCCLGNVRAVVERIQAPTLQPH